MSNIRNKTDDSKLNSYNELLEHFMALAPSGYAYATGTFRPRAHLHL